MHDLNDHTESILGDKITPVSASDHQGCREFLIKFTFGGCLFHSNSSLDQTDCFSGLKYIWTTRKRTRTVGKFTAFKQNCLNLRGFP